MGHMSLLLSVFGTLLVSGMDVRSVIIEDSILDIRRLLQVVTDVDPMTSYLNCGLGCHQLPKQEITGFPIQTY